MRIVKRLLRAATRLLPEPNVIYDREGVSPYLSRWYLFGRRTAESGEVIRKRPLNLFLHCFHRSDMDSALHSHPWAWGVSLVLCGGYYEDRQVGDKVVRRRVRPGRLNLIGPETFHRVDLCDGEAWTLFLAGPSSGTWYFRDLRSKETYVWWDFIRRVRGDVGSSRPPQRAEA